MYDDILIATDGSEIATRAVEQGLVVAKTVDATVHVVYVATVDADTDPGVEDRRRIRGQEIVDDVANEAAKRGISSEAVVLQGQPYQELLTYAEKLDADLLVLGTHGRTGIKRWVLGSVATTVIRAMHAPVLSVNAHATNIPRHFDDILIATDARPGSNAAIEHGVELADAYDARIHALYVINDTHSQLQSVIDAFEGIGRRATEGIAAYAAEHDVKVIRATERGPPHEGILEYAGDNDVDLVVMGTESRTGLDRLAFGSVSQRVVSSAPTPVLTVRSTVG